MGLFGGSKSSTSSSTTNNEFLDNSNIQALGAARGDNNTVTVTDNDAIKDAFAFAQTNSDGTIKSLGDVLGTFGSLANKAFESASKTTSDALNLSKNSTSSLNDAISNATTKLQNNGIEPQLLIFAALGLVGVILFKKG